MSTKAVLWVDQPEQTAGYFLAVACPTDGAALRPHTEAIHPDARDGIAVAVCPECDTAWSITVHVRPHKLHIVDRPVRGEQKVHGGRYDLALHQGPWTSAHAEPDREIYP